MVNYFRPDGIRALAGMAIEGAAFIEEENEQGDIGKTEKVTATNPAAELGDQAGFRIGSKNNLLKNISDNFFNVSRKFEITIQKSYSDYELVI